LQHAFCDNGVFHGVSVNDSSDSPWLAFTYIANKSEQLNSLIEKNNLKKTIRAKWNRVRAKEEKIKEKPSTNQKHKKDTLPHYFFLASLKAR
jgi:hypothetical protein